MARARRLEVCERACEWSMGLWPVTEDVPGTKHVIAGRVPNEALTKAGADRRLVPRNSRHSFAVTPLTGQRPLEFGHLAAANAERVEDLSLGLRD